MEADLPLIAKDTAGIIRIAQIDPAKAYYPPEAMYQHQHAPLPLEQLEGVPQPVIVLLEVLLEKDPGRRFQNPAELLNAITTIAGVIAARRRIARQSLQKTPSTASRAVTRRPQVPNGGVIDVQALAFDETDVILGRSSHVCEFLVQVGTELSLWKELALSTPGA